MRVVIIGAGPAGLGAGLGLSEIGHKEWLIYEKENHVGGLSSSYIDDAGFTWDLGGHVLFSLDSEFNAIINGLMAGECYKHEREAWIRYEEKWIPYPFQNNIQHLNWQDRVRCVLGLVPARILSNHREANNFQEWAFQTFGRGIFNCFMQPYNRKVWSYPLDMMSYQWIGERVSIPSISRVIRNTISRDDDISWGPNNTFDFPRKGGTGDIYMRMARVISANIILNSEVVKIKSKQKRILISDGSEDEYDILINTMPLDDFIDAIEDEDIEGLIDVSRGLCSNMVTVVGVGIDKPNPSKKCWMYFPSTSVPFYRVTNFSHYSPYNVPGGETDKFSSIMCETSHMGQINERMIVERTLNGLVEEGFLDKTTEPVSIFVKTIPKAYPIPTIDRDIRLSKIHKYLNSNDIYSIGRFGTWRYEIGNMDHAVMMGIRLTQMLKEQRGG